MAGKILSRIYADLALKQDLGVSTQQLRLSSHKTTYHPQTHLAPERYLAEFMPILRSSKISASQ
jgi:hypothetical protein